MSTVKMTRWQECNHRRTWWSRADKAGGWRTYKEVVWCWCCCTS